MTVPQALRANTVLPGTMVSGWPKILTRPEYLFLLFGTVPCLILLFLIPPLAGGNETNNFQRVAAIASGHLLIEPASVPGGVVKLLDAANRDFPAGAKPPYGYSVSRFRRLAAVPLARDAAANLNPNAIAIHNPIAYVPQVSAYWIGLALGFPPLVLFYLCRIFGAVAAIGLTFFAIRRMPFQPYGLAALALLPTIMFSRSTLDADQFTNAIAFFFTANVLAAMVGSNRLTAASIAKLVVSGFLIAQCKSAYLVLPLLAFAIPMPRYGSRSRWLLGSALIVVPGLAVGIAWMLAIKFTYFAGLHYQTWAGSVYPDGQVARILANPLAYLAVVLRSIFLSNLIPTALLGLIGIFGPPVQMPVVYYVVLSSTLILVLAGGADRNVVSVPAAVWWLGFGIFVVGFVLILTLLYVQWDGLGAHMIAGFQGRYLYPLVVPLLVCLRRAQAHDYLGFDACWWTGVLGATALFGTVLVTWTTYWA